MNLPLQGQAGGGANSAREDHGAFGAWCRNLAYTESNQTCCTFTVPSEGFSQLLLGLFCPGPHSHGRSRTDMIHKWKPPLTNFLTPKPSGWNSSIVTEAWRLSSQVSAAKWQTCKKMYEVDVFPFTFLLGYLRNLSCSSKLSLEKDPSFPFSVPIKWASHYHQAEFFSSKVCMVFLQGFRHLVNAQPKCLLV